LFFVVIAFFIDKVENFGFEFGLDFLEKSWSLDFLEDFLFESFGGFHEGISL
jgi:hypothetical protein